MITGTAHTGRVRTAARTWGRACSAGLMALLGIALVTADVVRSDGPAAIAETTLVADTFQRTVAGGWTGGGIAYTSTAGASRLSVAPGRGTMQLTPGATTQATVASNSATDMATRLSFSLSKISTAGSGAYVGPMVRVGSAGAYRLSARAASGGAFTLALERVSPTATVTVLKSSSVITTLIAGQPITLRLQATGTSSVALTGQVFLGSSTSAASTISYSDTDSAQIVTSGVAAVWSYLSRTSEAATVSVSSFTVSDLATTAAPGPDPDPTVPVSGTVGSVPVGAAQYAVPANAVFVAPSGSDASNGTQAAPYKTVTKAVNASPSGSTIVLRAGSYTESVMVPKEKTVAIQAYPKEAAWLDGSQSVTGFTKSGTTWAKTGWNYIFDASPTFARGAADGAPPSWQFVNPSYPMAAHPDQVWINDVRQTQVGSITQVKAGTFFVDRTAKRLHLGTDPTDKSVRASTVQIGLTILSKNSSVKGIGIRRYAPSVPDMGAVRLFGADGSTLENVVISESATLGLAVSDSTTMTPTKVVSVTVANNGLMGMGSNRSNGLVVDRVLVKGNNSERFNPAPSAGGFKLSRAANVSVTNSTFVENWGSGLWFDESSTNIVAARNESYGNTRHGIVVELSARARVVNNLLYRNADTGLLVLDSNRIDVWNNSIRDSVLPVRIADGSRVVAGGSEATGITKDITFKNNAVGDATAAGSSNWCGIVCVLDDRRLVTAAQMNAVVDGNLYYRATAGVPRLTIRWANGSGPRDFSTLAAFRTATGQEEAGAEILGTSLVDDRGMVRSSSALPGVGVKIPSEIASVAGIPTGSVAVGARR